MATNILQKSICSSKCENSKRTITILIKKVESSSLLEGEQLIAQQEELWQLRGDRQPRHVEVKIRTDISQGSPQLICLQLRDGLARQP